MLDETNARLIRAAIERWGLITIGGKPRRIIQLLGEKKNRIPTQGFPSLSLFFLCAHCGNGGHKTQGILKYSIILYLKSATKK